MLLKIKYIKYFYCCLVLTVGGCLLTPGPYYLGDYTVRTKEAKRHDFGNDLKALAFKLGSRLGYEVSINEGAGGVILIGIYSKDSEHDPTRPKIDIEWYNNSASWFSIGILKNGPDETAETLRVRQCIESILSENPSFRWHYEVAHRTMAR